MKRHSPARPGQGQAAGGLRSLPSVDQLARRLGQLLDLPHPVAVRAARTALVDLRQRIRSGTAVDDAAVLTRALAAAAEECRPGLRPVINATGVILSTNLGRAPLGRGPVEAMTAVAGGYSNLEYDLEAGGRGSRQTPVKELLRTLTGAEDALVVNNNAAAVLLVLAALAHQRDVVVSRGELVEIGGGFRIPEVLGQSGARLVEVGTTNRTLLRDFEAAVSGETAAFLRVHPSNFKIVGFTASPPLQDLAALAHSRGLVLIHDVGSGCLLATERWGLPHEPTPQESVAAGADIVCFSGDKLLGGPQAGIIVGREALLGQIERHPLMRAVRIDKLTLSALEATLCLYRDGAAERELPVWRAVAWPLAALRERAERWAQALRERGYEASAIADVSAIGGGSLPDEVLPTVVCAVALSGGEAASWVERLRQGSPAVIARIAHGRLLLDPRTVAPDEDEGLLGALCRSMPQ